MFRFANAVRVVACAVLLVCAGGMLSAAPLGSGGGSTRLPTDIATANSRTRAMLRGGQLQRAMLMTRAAGRIDQSDLEAAKLRSLVAALLTANEKTLVELIGRIKKLGTESDVPPLAQAWLDLRKKETDKAIQRLKDHIKKDPYDPFMAANYYSMGIFHVAKKDLGEAKKWLLKSLQPDRDSPHFLQGYLYLSQLLERENQMKRAAQVLARAKTHFQPNDQVNRLMGEFFLRRNNGRRAYAEFKEVLQRHKGQPQYAVRMQAARALLMQGYFQEAVKEFKSIQTGVGVSKKLVSLAIYSLAGCYARLGDFDAASNSYTEFLKSNPEDANALLRLSLLEMTGENASQVAKRLENVIKKEPKLLAASWVLSLAYRMNGDLKSSLQTLEAGGKRLVDVSTAKKPGPVQDFFLAMHHLAAGNLKLAREHFAKTRGFLPGFTSNSRSDFSPNGIELKKDFPKGTGSQDLALSVLCYVMGWNELTIVAADRVTKKNRSNLLARVVRGSALARQSRFRSGDPEAGKKLRQRAQAEFAKIAADKPLYSTAYLSLYRIAAFLENTPKEARAHLQAYLEKGPKDAKALVRVAGLFSGVGDYGQAIRALKRALAIDPKDKKLHITLAAIYSHEKVKDFSNAADHYKKALELDPDLDLVRAELLKILLNEQKKYGEVLVHAKKFKDLEKIPATYALIATAQARRRDFAGARETLDKLLKHFPDAPGYILLKALAETGSGNVDKGIALLKPLANKKAPAVAGPELTTLAKTGMALAVLYNAKGDHASAEKYLANVSAAFKKLQDDSQDARTRTAAGQWRALTAFFRANVAVSAGNFPAAIKFYDQAEPLGNGFDLKLLDIKGFLKALKKPAVFSRINLAELYAAYGWFEAAVAEMESVVKADKKNFIALFVQARALGRIRVESAEPLFLEIARLQPKFPAARIALFTIYKRMDNTEKAIVSLLVAVQIDPKNLMYRRRLANFLYEREKYAAAAAHYERLIKEESGDANSYMPLGDCYGKLGRKALQIQVYEKMVKGVPDDARGYNQASWYIIMSGQDQDRAIELADKGVQICRANPRRYGAAMLGTVLDTAAWAHIKKAEKTKDAKEKKALMRAAETRLTEAARLVQGRMPSIMYHLCVAMEGVEKYKDAKQLGQLLLDNLPAFDDRREVKKLVKRVSKKIKKKTGDSN